MDKDTVPPLGTPESVKQHYEQHVKAGQNSSTGAGDATSTPTTGTAASKVTFRDGFDGKVAANVHKEKTEELAKLRESLNAKDITQENKIKISGEMDGIKKIITPDKEAAFKELGPVEKFKASAGGNFGKNAGTMGKIGRGAVSLGGLIVLGSGVKNLIAPERDEQGERKNSTWKQVGKVGAGALLTYLAVTHGGAAKSMGIH